MSSIILRFKVSRFIQYTERVFVNTKKPITNLYIVAHIQWHQGGGGGGWRASPATILSLTWESPYLGNTIFILKRGSVCYSCSTDFLVLFSISFGEWYWSKNECVCVFNFDASSLRTSVKMPQWTYHNYAVIMSVGLLSLEACQLGTVPSENFSCWMCKWGAF